MAQVQVTRQKPLPAKRGMSVVSFQVTVSPGREWCPEHAQNNALLPGTLSYSRVEEQNESEVHVC